MKKIVLSIGMIIGFLSFSSAQKIHVTFFGSSVCYGASAENHHGYGWQVFHSGAIDTTTFIYFNASTGGDNTLKVEKEKRITKKLLPTNPDIVVIGLSLGNEGIRTPQDDNGREQILEQYRSRLLSMADSFNSMGIKPVIVNCYTHTYFTDAHYEYTKRMNRLINTWEYPSINVLGTIDDWSGKWVEGYVGDPWHPNTEGHKEMSYAIVPSLFEAITKGKKVPEYDWNKSYSTVINEKQIENPISMDIENTMHSFTLSFRFQVTDDGSIAGFSSNDSNHTINIKGHTIQYKELKTIYPKHLKYWTHVVLSHSYANQKTMLFVNGALIGAVNEQLSPNQIHFGGTASKTELKDLAVYRSCLNPDEALDLYNKKFIQSSLEIYSPLTKPIEGKTVENKAQSMANLEISKYIKIECTDIELY